MSHHPSPGRTREERIAAAAAGQHGVVTRAQLMDAGISAAAIGRRLKAGRLRALHRGVYLVGSIEPDRAPEMAAALAGGPTAALSHTSALHVWNLLGLAPPRPIHVSGPASRDRRRSGIVFHRISRPWGDDECRSVGNIRVTAPGRTIVDAAGILGRREIELALAKAEREGLLGGEELARLPDRYPRRRGMAMLRCLIKEQSGPQLTESEAERRCLELIRIGGMSRPHTNVTVGPYRLDLFWPDLGVAVEVDARAYHSSTPRFEGDRQKDNWLRARGMEVIRVTWRQITRDPTRTSVQIGQALAWAQARREAAALTPQPTAVSGSSSGLDEPAPSSESVTG